MTDYCRNFRRVQINNIFIHTVSQNSYITLQNIIVAQDQYEYKLCQFCNTINLFCGAREIIHDKKFSLAMITTKTFSTND